MRPPAADWAPPTALTTPTVTVFESERVADRHDPVAGRDLRGVAELATPSAAGPAARSTAAGRCPSARRGRRAWPEESARRCACSPADTSISVASFDHVVVGQDEAGLVDDEAAARAIEHLPRRPAAAAGRCSAPNRSNWKKSSRRRGISACASSDADHLGLASRDGSERAGVERPEIGALLAPARRAVRANESGVMPSCDAMTIPTTSDARAINSVEDEDLRLDIRTPLPLCEVLRCSG